MPFLVSMFTASSAILGACDHDLPSPTSRIPFIWYVTSQMILDDLFIVANPGKDSVFLYQVHTNTWMHLLNWPNKALLKGSDTFYVFVSMVDQTISIISHWL